MENWYVLYLLFMYVLSISFILVCVDTNLCRTHSNALERANDRQNDQHQRNPGKAGLTGAADRSDRFRQGFTKT